MAMSKPFDGYHKWLGIPPEDQPPNHYRLLGINPFESHPDVIESAADQRMSHLRSFQTGQNADESQKLLNEVAAARVCLLKPETKSRYDRLLKAKLAKERPAAPAPPVSAPIPATVSPSAVTLSAVDDTIANAADLDFTTPAQPATTDWQADAMRHTPATLRRTSARGAQRKSNAPLMLAIGVPAAVIAVGLVIFVALGNKSDQPAQADSTGSGQDIAAAQAKKYKEKNPGDAGDSIAKDKAKLAALASQSIVPPPRKNTPGNSPLGGPRVTGPAGSNVAESPESELADVGISATDLARRQQLKMPDDNGAKNPSSKEPNSSGSSKSPGVGDQSTASSSGGDAKPASGARRPIPDEAAQQKALQQLKELLKDDFAQAKTPDGQLELARKLEQLATDTKNDPNSSYVAFAQALDFATKCGDSALAMEVVDAMAKSFDLDVWDLRQKTLTQLAHAAKTDEARSAVAHSAIELAEQAISDSHFDAAVALTTTALNLSAAVKDNALRDQARDVSERTKRLQKEQPALDLAMQKLKTSPDDADANLAVGRIKCFLMGDWQNGLPYLSKGSDEVLKALAKQETAAPSAADEQAKLADAWWDQAEKKGERKDDPILKAMRARALYWYRLALPNLTGLALTKAQKRVDSEETTKPDAPITETAYLDDLPELDLTLANLALGKHGDTGYSKIGGRPVVTGGGKKGRITVIPGAPPPPQRVVLGGVEAQHALSLQPQPNGRDTVAYDLAGKYRLFNGTAALMDDANPQAAVLFRVLADGKQIWVSRPMRRAGESQTCTLKIAKAKKLEFEILCNGTNAGAMTAWINPAVGR
jgi:NPCBM/NEW2 domain